VLHPACLVTTPRAPPTTTSSQHARISSHRPRTIDCGRKSDALGRSRPIDEELPRVTHACRRAQLACRRRTSRCGRLDDASSYPSRRPVTRHDQVVLLRRFLIPGTSST
jgi:hypothetical protein